MTVHNRTHLEFDFQSDNLGGAVIDSVVLTEDARCGFGAACPVGRGEAGRVAAGRTEVERGEAAKCRAMAARRDHRVAELRACWSRGSQATLQTGSGRPMCGTAARGRPMGPGTHPDPAAWTPTPTPTPTVPAAQRRLHVELHAAAHGGGWRRNANWLRGDPCNPAAPWYGVGCARVTDTMLPNTSAGAGFGVTAIQLAANNLTGTIPPTLADVFGGTLQLLDLSDNSLSGAVPASLLAMPRLHSLFRYGKGVPGAPLLQGGLPDPICTPALRNLHLQRQNRTGSIPLSVSMCSGLSQLMLTGNRLSGVVPHALTNLPLGEVNIADNNFSCPLPCFRKCRPYASEDCAKCPTPAGECYPCNYTK